MSGESCALKIKIESTFKVHADQKMYTGIFHNTITATVQRESSLNGNIDTCNTL